MSTVSVVVPTYNRPQYLADALGTVSGQTYGDYEVVVVDDGSDCDVGAVIESAEGSERVTLLREPNRGRSAARNTGAEVAGGRFLAFLDDDDLWEPGKLQRQVKFLERHDDVGLVHTFTVVIGPDRELREGATAKRLAEHRRAARAGHGYAQMCERCVAFVSSVVVRRDLFESLGGFDEEIDGLEDWDFYLRVALESRMEVIEDPLVRYRSHPENTSPEQFLGARIHTAQKHLSILDQSCDLTTREETRARAALHGRLREAYYMRSEGSRCRRHAVAEIREDPSRLLRSRALMHALATLAPRGLLRYARHLKRRFSG